MAGIGFSQLAAPTSVTAGAATDVSGFNGFTVSVEGNTGATYQVQISLDQSASPASGSWQNEGTAFTSTSGTLAVTKQAAWVRINCTAYASGTPTCRVAGMTQVAR